MTGCYTRRELTKLGLAGVGDAVYVHRTVLFFGARRIHLGSHVRIDAYAVISAGDGRARVRIGNYVHVSTGVSILGSGGVDIADFCSISVRVAVFSSSDDFRSGAMGSPMVPRHMRQITIQPVSIEKHVIIGAGTVILPGVRLGTGAAIGALSVVRQHVPPFTVAAGNPLRLLGKRGRLMLKVEKELRARPSRTNHTSSRST